MSGDYETLAKNHPDIYYTKSSSNMKQIFSNQFYYQFKMPDFDILKERLETIEKFDDGDFTWGELCKIERDSYNVNDFFDILVKPVGMLSGQLGVKFNAKISHPWLNRYDRGGFQEIHYHDDCDIAAVVFLNDGEDFSKFYFWDSNHTAFTKPWIKILTQMKLSNIYYPEVKAGDVLLFPSHMLHGVSPHNSDIIRKTFSFNVIVTNVE